MPSGASARASIATLPGSHESLDGADRPATQAAYTGELALALQKFQAADRVATLNAVGCAHGLAPLPGQPGMPGAPSAFPCPPGRGDARGAWSTCHVVLWVHSRCRHSVHVVR